MKRKKISLNEELKKLSELASVLKEAAPVQGAQPVANAGQAQTQTQQQGQRAPQQNQQPPQQGGQQQNQVNPQVADKNLTANVDQAMGVVIKNLPNILANFTATVGDKDKQLDIGGEQQGQPQNQQQKQPQGQQVQAQNQQQGQIKESDKINELKFNEEEFRKHVFGGELDEALITTVLGTIASAPAVMKLAGWGLSKLGKKGDNNVIQKAGAWLTKKGDALHHKYIHGIEAVVKKFMPNATPEQSKKASEAIFMTIVAGLFVSGLGDPSSYKQMLTTVKGGELGQVAAKVMAPLMKGAGFA